LMVCGSCCKEGVGLRRAFFLETRFASKAEVISWRSPSSSLSKPSRRYPCSHGIHFRNMQIYFTEVYKISEGAVNQFITSDYEDSMLLLQGTSDLTTAVVDTLTYACLLDIGHPESLF
jgi:hypothetical protein